MPGFRIYKVRTWWKAGRKVFLAGKLLQRELWMLSTTFSSALLFFPHLPHFSQRKKLI
jgi:hypothetical protein